MLGRAGPASFSLILGVRYVPQSTKRGPEGPAVPAVEAPAVLVERWGERAGDDRRAAVYRQAGDRYLAEGGDLESALRCYRNALDAGPEEGTTISADDTWLMMVLKDARQKEKRNAPTDG